MADFSKVVPKIFPVREETPDPRIKPVHPNIMTPPSLCLVIGSVKSGKTTLLNSLLLQPRENGFYGQNYFDIVKIISNTINNDPTARFLKKAFDVSDHYTEGQIQDIIASQDKYESKEKMPTMALILDDILGTNFKRNNEISFLATRFRHKNILLMLVTTQNFKSVDNILRNNATDVIINKQTNQKQLMSIVEEYHSVFGSPENFLKIYHMATEGKYNFLYLKLGEAKAFRNFETLLAEGENIIHQDTLDQKDRDKIFKMAEKINETKKDDE